LITEYLSQHLAIAADGIHSASVSTSGATTGAVDLSKFRKVLFVIDTGTLGTSGTLDFQVTGSATSGGTYTAIPNTAITQIVKASGDNKYAIVEVDSGKVGALNLGYLFIKGSLTPGTAAANSAVFVLGAYTRFEPASAQNPAAVVQTVVLI
jgi:hypothetical protein